ncbi:MAG TPA: histidine kinase [Puia sp.]|nr:histidine kinase [Puia sp.]
MVVNRQINYKRILKHLLFWLAYTLYQILQQLWENTDEFSFHARPQLFTNIPIDILFVYINLYVLMPHFYYKRRYVQYVLTLIVLLLADGIVARYFTWAVWLNWDKLHNPDIYLSENKNFFIPVRILRNSVQTYPVIAVTMLIKLMDNSFKQEKQLREIEKEKFSAELRLLKAQINPHFFFNTLNSLYALTLKGSAQASKVVLRLSDLMHYMLYEASSNKVLLKDEIKYLENYISIEQLRFAERLDLSFQYSGDIEGKHIAPLLMLPFVENAFKHGVENDKGWVTINLNVIGSRLFLKVENSCTAVSKQKSSGMGLKNVKRRLELMYPGNYQLTINETAGAFEAELEMDI